MEYPTWNDYNFFLTKKEAEALLDASLPRQSGKVCACSDMGYHCTEFQGHSGNHEARGNGAFASQVLHSWPNRNTVYTI